MLLFVFGLMIKRFLETEKQKEKKEIKFLTISK
jgi:hypothetical protein